MKDEKQSGNQQKEKPNHRTLLVVFAILAFFVATSFIGKWSDTQREIADKQYLASITPEERQIILKERVDIELAKQHEEQKKQEESNKFWNELLTQPSVPIFWVIVIFAAGQIMGWSLKDRMW